MKRGPIEAAEWHCGDCESAAVSVAYLHGRLNGGPAAAVYRESIALCGSDIRKARASLIAAVFEAAAEVAGDKSAFAIRALAKTYLDGTRESREPRVVPDADASAPPTSGASS